MRKIKIKIQWTFLTIIKNPKIKKIYIYIIYIYMYI